MYFRARRIIHFVSVIVLASPSLLAADEGEGSGPGAPSADAITFFEAKVRPLLIERCYDCHSLQSGESSGGLRLDSAQASRAGGSRGAAVVPGDLEASLLVKAIEYSDEEIQMPPDQKMSEEEIAVLRHWIETGAADPREDLGPATVSPLERDPKTHWAFVAPERSAPPPRAPGTGARSRDEIDDWAEYHARSIGLELAPEASRETLIRRVYFDLTGLPPSPEVIDQFVQSRRPDAYARVVDELLASPEFGERFARHWLDVARYADTVGYDFGGKDRRLQGSERFRDWTIRAFASDMPYDEMIHHQLAGDRTDPDNSEGNLDAMGFLTVGRKFINGLDTVDDRIDVITRGLLGLTVTCARCHDHKFDPIPASDYYSIFGILQSSRVPENGASPLMLVDKDDPHDSPVLLRGQAGNRGPIAPRQFLTALRKPDEPRFTDGSGRRELADRITDSGNPLTARVMVNRVWGILIGSPLVSTPSDFGFRTEPPLVPEALDNLASEFSEHWSIKRLVRRIVMTRIYRQSSTISDLALEKDTDNRYLARANRRRRDFESLRDSMLVKSALLDRVIGGAPVEITQPEPTPRRTVYAMIDRQFLPSIFRTFDFASPDIHSPGRYYTTVPQQSLYLLNSEQMFSLARNTAQRIRRETASQEPADLTRAAFTQVLGREPSESELTDVVDFLKKPLVPAETAADPRSLWSYAIATLAEDGSLKDVAALPVFANNQWQGEEEFPSPGNRGYASLGAERGHTPRDTNLAILRRWTSPTDGKVKVSTRVGHAQADGDGIRVIIDIGGERRFDEQHQNDNRRVGPLEAKIAKGQTIDLIAAAGATDSHDSFSWKTQIQLITDDGQRLDADSESDFSGPFESRTLEPLDRLEQLAQVLLMSNEFAFVD